ncbi:MAG TPA: polysaccharide biosynthesis tyrosine autokinase [Candidatus Saccharimonadales bacterium]|jgi:succinoglycan biosynthesis transport protein ExoP|nr:polysaccharide biosynthesis tyrosine autokinase [Candidatus Saccharimonadales bacterium]
MNQHNRQLARPLRRELPLAWTARSEPRVSGSQQLSIAEIGTTILKRKIPIFGLAALIFMFAAVYSYVKVPQYEGVARLQIDPNRPSDVNLNERDKLEESDVDSRVKTEVEIIHSNGVILQVIQSLRMFANSAFAGPDTAIVANITDLSPSVRRRLLDKFSNNLTVKVVPNTQIVEVRFRSPDPELAGETSNSIVDEYMQRTFQARVDGSAQVSQWLSRQMEEIRAKTSDAQQKLANFQRENNLLGSDEKDNIVTDRLKKLNQELTEAEADRIVKEARYRLSLSADPELMSSIAPSTTLQILRTQEATLQGQYAQLNSKFGEGYPKLGEIQTQLSRVKSAIQDEDKNLETRLTNEFDAASKSEAMVRVDFEKQKSEAYRLNEHVAQYALLKHDVESGQQLYDTLQLKVKEAGVTSGLASSFVNVIDRAQLPDTPVEPRRKLYMAFGLGGGLFAGLLLGFALESFDDTCQTSEEIETIIGLPELGSVPFLPALATERSKFSSSPRLNLVLESPGRPISLANPAAAESYHALFSVIMLSSTPVMKVLVVTSAMAGDGKTTTTCNLATVLAQHGKRVLLVDADLRRSSIGAHFGLKPGFTKMVSVGKTSYQCYQPIDVLPNLFVIPATLLKSGATDALATHRLQMVVRTCRPEYDFIIVDTPPALPFADALVLSACADGVLLVARSGVSRNKALLRARDVLQRSGANILGFVLNAVRRPAYYYSDPTQYDQLPPCNVTDVSGEIRES